jgi:phytoene synthase
MPSTFENDGRFRPFLESPWKGEHREIVELLWAWRRQLLEVDAPAVADDPLVFFQDEAARVRRGEAPRFVEERVSHRLFEYVKAYNLPLDWLARQTEAAHFCYRPVRLADVGALTSFLGEWVSPHGYLLARLAGAAHSWQLRLIDELATAYFLVDHIVHLPADLKRDRFFIPFSELEQAGATLDQVKQGELTAGVRRLLWKQAIRIRDAFAQGQPLVNELPRSYRRPFKRYWLTGLELIDEVERRKYDLWSSPIALSGRQRFQVEVLSIIGKGAGKARR